MRLAALKRLIDPRRPITYGIVQAGEDVDGGVPYIRPVDMQPWARDLDPAGLRTTHPDIAATYRRSTVAAGDIVISIGPSYGKLLLVPQRLAGANLTQGTARLAPAPFVEARFLQYCVATHEARAWWRASVGGATFGGLNLGPLSLTPVPFPPSLPEQRAIADTLDRESNRVAELIGRSERLQEASLANHWEAAINELLLPDVSDPKWTRLKYLTEPPTAGSWGADIGGDECDVPVVRVADFDRQSLAVSQCRTLRSVSRSSAARLALRVGDLLMEKSGGGERSPVGFVARYEGEPGAIFSNFIVRVRPRVGVDATYLQHVFGALYGRQRNVPFVRQVTGIQNLDVHGYLGLHIPARSVAEQMRLASRLDARLVRTNSLRLQCGQLVARLTEYRDALITEAVTGKLDVTKLSDAQLDESAHAALEGETPEVLAS